MACGVHLGILLICLVQAEHVRCLWAPQAQRQNGNAYVGFSQQDSGLRRLGGSYPQNQFRQASISPGSVQSSSLNPETALSGYNNRGLSSSSYMQTVSQPAQRGHAPVKLAQSNLVSKPSWRTTNSKQVNTDAVPKRHYFGLSTDIASASSVSKYMQKKDDRSDGRGRAWPVQQGTQRTKQYPSSSSASVRSPSRERNAFTSTSHQSAKTPSYYSQRDFSPSMKTSSLFSTGALAPQPNSARTRTSASAPARRVHSHRGAEASKPSRFSATQNERARQAPGQTETTKRYQSKLFPATGGNAQGGYKPTSNTASSHVTYTQPRPEPYKQNVNFQPRSLNKPASQRFNYKPSSTSTERIPSGTSSVRAIWDRNPAQGARNLPDSRSGKAGSSSRRFAPTRTHNIPQHLGGSAIRRLEGPERQEVGVKKPQEISTAPPRETPSYRPQGQSVHQASKWMRLKLHQGH